MKPDRKNQSRRRRCRRSTRFPQDVRHRRIRLRVGSTTKVPTYGHSKIGLPGRLGGQHEHGAWRAHLQRACCAVGCGCDRKYPQRVVNSPATAAGQRNAHRHRCQDSFTRHLPTPGIGLCLRDSCCSSHRVRMHRDIVFRRKCSTHARHCARLLQAIRHPARPGPAEVDWRRTARDDAAFSGLSPGEVPPCGTPARNC